MNKTHETMFTIHPEIFKANDIRGTYPDQIDTEFGYRLGRAIVIHLKAKRLVVGRDMRDSSAEMADALIRGCLDEGCDIVDAGMICSPHLLYAINAGVKDVSGSSLVFDGGMMLTASHNTSAYCGIKMSRERGIPIGRDTGLKEIRAIVERDDWSTAQNLERGRLSTYDFFPEYLEFVAAGVEIEPMKVVMDAGNGMQGAFMERFAARLGLTLVPMYFDLDGTFPNHEANPLKKETCSDLMARVVSENAAIGFAFDGDGDRLGVIDEHGQYVSGDLLTALISQYLLREYKGEKIVYDLRSSHATREAIIEAGGVPILCQVGHSFIKKKMRDEDAIFGGELSSHFYWKECFYGDNIDFAMVTLLRILSETAEPLSAHVARLKKYWHSGEINSTVSDAKAIVEILEKHFGATGTVNHLDGLTIDFGTWWFNVRSSNTEPLLRLTLESKISEDDMIKKRDQVLALIRGS